MDRFSGGICGGAVTILGKRPKKRYVTAILAVWSEYHSYVVYEWYLSCWLAWKLFFPQTVFFFMIDWSSERMLLQYKKGEYGGSCLPSMEQIVAKYTSIPVHFLAGNSRDKLAEKIDSDSDDFATEGGFFFIFDVCFFFLFQQRQFLWQGSPMRMWKNWPMKSTSGPARWTKKRWSTRGHTLRLLRKISCAHEKGCLAKYLTRKSRKRLSWTPKNKWMISRYSIIAERWEWLIFWKDELFGAEEKVKWAQIHRSSPPEGNLVYLFFCNDDKIAVNVTMEVKEDDSSSCDDSFTDSEWYLEVNKLLDVLALNLGLVMVVKITGAHIGDSRW